MIISGIFFSNGIRTGGHTRYIELLEGLAAKGHTVYLYYNDELSLNTKHVQLIPVSVHYVYHKTKRLGSLFAKKLREYIKRRSAIISDYVLVFGETNWKAAHILSGKVNAKILFAFRSDGIQEALMYLKYEKLSFKTYLFQIAYMFRQFIREKSIAKKAAIIFFQSKYDENNFLKRNLLCKAKTKVVRGDIRQDRFLKEYAFSNTSVHCSKLLFVGNFGLRKGLSYLLEAVLKLEKQDGFDFSLTIIGPDSEENPLNDFLKKNNLHSIQYLGRKDNPLEYMKNADILIVPSLFDSYPNTVLEALHTGLLVIGSRTGGIPDMLQYDELLFDPADSEQIYTILKKIMTNDDEYMQYRELCNSRRSYFDFDWAGLWEKEIEAYSEGQ